MASSLVQAPKEQNVIPAALGGAATLLATQAAEAYSFTGPLTGSEVCKSKPLVWFIYPLCDPIFVVSPLYLYPICPALGRITKPPLVFFFFLLLLCMSLLLVFLV